MKKERIPMMDHLWVITILFFALGFVNIGLSLAGLICMILPFILYWKSGEKLWCKNYCPRASLFLRVLSRISLKKPLPKGFTKQKVKTGVLIYFGLNLFFATMSTIMVSLGRVAPIDYLRFLIAFPIPIDLPQLIRVDLSPWFLHLSFRIYSMMLTSTTIGLILGFLYVPRAWCVICPIQTLTTKRPVNILD
ncbi:4Fe-4S binding protein [Gottschalkiaceae bacterium SANA]|nr:4Fe-4S binding protein [Gottschalkiaceae bacterium SANA]